MSLVGPVVGQVAFPLPNDWEGRPFMMSLLPLVLVCWACREGPRSTAGRPPVCCGGWVGLDESPPAEVWRRFTFKECAGLESPWSSLVVGSFHCYGRFRARVGTVIAGRTTNQAGLLCPSCGRRRALASPCETSRPVSLAHSNQQRLVVDGRAGAHALARARRNGQRTERRVGGSGGFRWKVCNQRREWRGAVAVGGRGPARSYSFCAARKAAVAGVGVWRRRRVCCW